MRNKNIWLIGLVCFSLITYFFIATPITTRKQIEKKQDELAKVLGIKLDGNNRRGFPVTYFLDHLEPGMTVEEVHEIVIGYDSVYRCPRSFKNELYYYFGDKEGIATRFMIFYDTDGRYEDLLGEDPNSLEFGDSGGCLEGPIGE